MAATLLVRLRVIQHDRALVLELRAQLELDASTPTSNRWTPVSLDRAPPEALSTTDVVSEVLSSA